MAIAVEAFCVVGNLQTIDAADLLSRDALTDLAPNSNVLNDDDLWRCSFMAESDAAAFLERLNEIGFSTTTGPNSDFVLVNEADQEITPYCEWLEVTTYQKGVIAWKVGSNPENVTARAGWTPEKGSGLKFGNRHRMEELEFVRLEGNVEVYRDKSSGELVYIGRTETPVEALYESSATVILQNRLAPGQPPVRGKRKQEISQAIEDLEKVVKNHPHFWRAHYVIGKGNRVIGDLENAYSAFHNAFEINADGNNVCRALISICLDTDRVEQALLVAIKEATLFPDNEETLGNLATCYLLNKQVPAARKTIDAALRLNPTSPVSQQIDELIQAVEAGECPCPLTLHEAQTTTLKRSSGSTFWSRLAWWR